MNLWFNKDTLEFRKLVGNVVNSDIWKKVPEETMLITKDDTNTVTFWKNEKEAFNHDDDWGAWINSDNDCVMSLSEYKEQEHEVLWQKDYGIKQEFKLVSSHNTKKFNPLVPQEGGDHYKLRPIQPIEYSERNSLSMCQGNIVKYITRHKEKNGVEDLSKVVHYCLLEAFFVYGEDGSNELKDKILKLLGDNNV